MRVAWRGNLCFGLVTIPVGLAAAQEREKIGFRTLHRDCGQPMAQGDTVCPEHGKVEPGETVRGYELAKGQYVVVEDADLEAIEPAETRTIAILCFVPFADVDSLYLDRAYRLVPDAAAIARRPYALLARALDESGMAAVVRFVWKREHLALVRCVDGALALQTLFDAEEVRSSAEIVEAIAGAEISKKEAELAGKLIARLAAPFDIGAFESSQRRVRGMLEAKLAGGDVLVVPEVEEAPPPPPANLAEALEESLRRVKPPAKRRARRRAPAAAR